MGPSHLIIVDTALHFKNEYTSKSQVEVRRTP